VTAIVPPRNVLRFIDGPPIGLVFLSAYWMKKADITT
jgi:hypothetical protein